VLTPALTPAPAPTPAPTLTPTLTLTLALTQTLTIQLRDYVTFITSLVEGVTRVEPCKKCRMLLAPVEECTKCRRHWLHTWPHLATAALEEPSKEEKVQAMAVHWRKRRPSSSSSLTDEDVQPLPYVPAAFNLGAVPAADGGTDAEMVARMRVRRSAVVLMALAAAEKAVAARAEAAAAAVAAAAHERAMERAAERANKLTVHGGIRPAGSHSIVDQTRPGAAGTEGSWSYGKATDRTGRYGPVTQKKKLAAAGTGAGAGAAGAGAAGAGATGAGAAGAGAAGAGAAGAGAAAVRARTAQKEPTAQKKMEPIRVRTDGSLEVASRPEATWGSRRLEAQAQGGGAGARVDQCGDAQLVMAEGTPTRAGLLSRPTSASAGSCTPTRASRPASAASPLARWSRPASAASPLAGNGGASPHRSGRAGGRGASQRSLRPNASVSTPALGTPVGRRHTPKRSKSPLGVEWRGGNDEWREEWSAEWKGGHEARQAVKAAGAEAVAANQLLRSSSSPPRHGVGAWSWREDAP
jgi:hypothetical protein